MYLPVQVNGKPNAAIVEATKGIMLYTCAECGSHQRTEPEVRNGKLGLFSPDKDCFCGGLTSDLEHTWLMDWNAVHILKLKGLLGFTLQVQAWWIEIKARIKNLILS